MDRSLQTYVPSQGVESQQEPRLRDDLPPLEKCILDWLSEKSGLSQSKKTEDAYAKTFHGFMMHLASKGHRLDAPTGVIRADAQEYCIMSKRDDAQGSMAIVAAATFNQRRSILSSFYAYAVVSEVLPSNPILGIKPRAGTKHAAHSLRPEQVKAFMDRIDRATPDGLRDYALLSIAFTTGHRASELASLRLGHIRKSEGKMIIDWNRVKGDHIKMNNVLEANVATALATYMASIYGEQWEAMSADTPIWISFSDRNKGKPIGTRTISYICEARIDTSKVHTTRHTAAVRLSRKNVPLADIGRFLGHSNLKTTSDYLEEQVAWADAYTAPMLGDDFGI